MFCSNKGCGYELEPDSRFCTQCGTAQPRPLATSLPSGTHSATPSHLMKWPNRSAAAHRDDEHDAQDDRSSSIGGSAPADFKFTRDYSKINWKATAQVNLIRAACAGPALGILMWIASGQFRAFLLYTLLFPVMYALVVLPMALAALWLSSLGVPFAGLFAAMMSLMVAMGDPLTSILSRKRPDWVPVERFGFFNLNPVIFVLN